MFRSSALLILILLAIKSLMQWVVLNSGYLMLSADDYCRTVKSYEWLQDPAIYSGVWLSPHFWLNGFMMLFFDDLVGAAMTVNFIYSSLALIFFFKIGELCFNKTIAFWSTLIFAIFPFQVWLGISGLSESIFFFFALAGIYYFLVWINSNQSSAPLILSAIAFAMGNIFRYEAWFFSVTFVILVAAESLRDKKKPQELYTNVAISLISIVTISWWFIQNYIDHGDAMFFVRETTKIFKGLNSASFLQRMIQYPAFIFYVAPVTTLFALKPIYDSFRGKEFVIVKFFILFNIVQLALLMIHGMVGTGGTNMITRYVVINSLLLLPLAVYQFFKLKKIVTVFLIASVIVINIIWSFYYPQPFRADTFEIGYLTRNLINDGYISKRGKIYFEELEGYYDIWAVKAISNDPDKFLLGHFPVTLKDETKTRTVLVDEDLDANILDIKNFFEKNNVQMAIVKSDSYRDKLSKLSLNYEELGDYKIFYIKDRESSLSDSTVTLLTKNVTNLNTNTDLINFGKLLGVNSFEIDNTNFGLNPQTVTVRWTATDKNILDSLDYENLKFERYKSVVEIRNIDNDSSVHKMTMNIFSERNIEELIEKSELKSIIVLRPFALLQYSRQYRSSPFEGGVYKLVLKVHDSKTGADLQLFKGTKPVTREIEIYDSTLSINDTLKPADTLSKRKVSDTLSVKPDSTIFNYNLGSIIAMFPDSDFNKIAQKKSDFIRITTQNWIQLLFSQRYQGDHVLNWIFNYF